MRKTLIESFGQPAPVKNLETEQDSGGFVSWPGKNQEHLVWSLYSQREGISGPYLTDTATKRNKPIHMGRTMLTATASPPPHFDTVSSFNHTILVYFLLL